jgi:MOSC domain-containing protein YiiM
MHALTPSVARLGPSGIDKRAVEGPVHVGLLGLDGDHIADGRHHGGNDQAVYAYSDEDADIWVQDLQRDLAPGFFGENLRVRGLSASDAVIGEQWQVGDPDTGPLLEVTSPRTPCQKFARKMGEEHWVKRFTQRGLTGTYLRTVIPGVVQAGDPIRLQRRPAHGVTIRRWFTEADADLAGVLLDAEREGQVLLQETLRREANKLVWRA